MNPERLFKLVKELLSGLWFECSEYSLHSTCSFAVALDVQCAVYNVPFNAYLVWRRIVCLLATRITHYVPSMKTRCYNGCKSLKKTKLGLRHVIFSSPDISFPSTQIFPSEQVMLNL